MRQEQPRSNLAVSSCNAESLCAVLRKAGNASWRPGGQQASSLYPVLGQSATPLLAAKKTGQVYPVTRQLRTAAAPPRRC